MIVVSLFSSNGRFPENCSSSASCRWGSRENVEQELAFRNTCGSICFTGSHLFFGRNFFSITPTPRSASNPWPMAIWKGFQSGRPQTESLAFIGPACNGLKPAVVSGWRDWQEKWKTDKTSTGKYGSGNGLFRYGRPLTLIHFLINPSIQFTGIHVPPMYCPRLPIMKSPYSQSSPNNLGSHILEQPVENEQRKDFKLYDRRDLRIDIIMEPFHEKKFSFCWNEYISQFMLLMFRIAKIEKVYVVQLHSWT